MRNSRDDVVARALAVLDAYGLGDLTMRRLGAELGVRPSALYHHFPDKQTLLGAVADEVLARGLGGAPATPPGDLPWDGVVLEACRRVRDALLAYRDGAELVATVRAFGLGGAAALEEVAAAVATGGFDDDLVATASRALLHLVLGHTGEEQTHLQAQSVGAIGGEPRPDSDFDAAVGLLVAGLRATTPGARADA
ncbi:TetR/AcrR family transcriptional regulator C-terminal domain-containing protein [Nocardioides lentus]|uniref:TetR/AcrR family transcriptional regulator C-terminal domain-containing protein n=1 Tax=Nocardioides lentus TaxID=338077 RepID=UPI0031CEDF5B